jgi:hypothetical protein
LAEQRGDGKTAQYERCHGQAESCEAFERWHLTLCSRGGKAVIIGVPEAKGAFTLSPFDLLDDEKT